MTNKINDARPRNGPKVLKKTTETQRRRDAEITEITEITEKDDSRLRCCPFRLFRPFVLFVSLSLSSLNSLNSLNSLINFLPVSTQPISCQKGYNLAPIKKLPWMGHT